MPVRYGARPALSAAQQQRLRQLELRTEQITQIDRAYFERNPARRHRVRLASKVELEALMIARGGPLAIPPGAAVFAVVRRLSADLRIRMFTVNSADAEIDLSETEAAAVFAVVMETGEPWNMTRRH
jgi:hypothetical protein